MKTENIIAKNLLQIKAIKLNLQNPFTWASGIKSPIYCDNRLTLSYPDVRNIIKKSLAELSTSFGEVNMIAGVATAGIAHGALLADELGLPFCYVRSKPKDHGRQNQIEGEIRDDAKILVVEDLISTGGSSIEVVEVLRDHGHEVSGVIAIFNYGFEKARDNFRKIDCKYLTLSNYEALINEAKAIQYINEDEAALLASWNQDPQGWYEKMTNR
ncbi:MAG: orotate phosphoribosyltransferase [Saprospiraceae bacterium]|nr:MAG: orotate phosphoribosyltransferase [Bacteroidetes bacterium OLB9]MCO6463014.1 orotate phosphoribosyltransferase [Saprospiraceae bacterium]